MTGNTFQVKRALANVNDLKKAIDPSLFPFQASKIDIYSVNVDLGRLKWKFTARKTGTVRRKARRHRCGRLPRVLAAISGQCSIHAVRLGVVQQAATFVALRLLCLNSRISSSGMQRAQGQLPAPAQSSFTEAFLVVLKCADNQSI